MRYGGAEEAETPFGAVAVGLLQDGGPESLVVTHQFYFIYQLPLKEQPIQAQHLFFALLALQISQPGLNHQLTGPQALCYEQLEYSEWSGYINQLGGMQIEHSVQKHTIFVYRNATTGVHYKFKDKMLLLELHEDRMIIRDEQQDKTIDLFYFKDLTFFHIVVPQGNTKSQVVCFIQEKHLEGLPTIAFRHADFDVCQRIYNFINKQIELYSEHANQGEAYFYRKELIKKLRAKESAIYNRIYDVEWPAFNHDWLDSFIFEDYQAVRDFDLLSKQKGYEAERKLILNKGKNLPRSSTFEQNPSQFHPKNLDVAKCDEGRRFYDDSKKSTFKMNDMREEDRDDDIIGEELPEARPQQIFEDFDKVPFSGDPMEVQHQTRLVTLQSDCTAEPGLKLLKPDKPDKEKFKLLQYKKIEVGGKGREERRDEGKFDEQLGKKVRAWVKIFYRIQEHSQVTAAHMDAISAELTKLQHADPKPPPYLEQLLSKTQANLLAWKRTHSKRLS